MRAHITVQMDNAAFDDDTELARVLRDLANRVHSHRAMVGDEWTARDTNGNTVGTLKIVGPKRR